VSTLPAIEPMTPEEFKQLRESLGLTQQQLAVHLGKTVGTISRWEASGEPIDLVAALAIRKLVEDARAANGSSSEVAPPRGNNRKR
jgi:DNA-binding transcriptional regulator YiaG